MKYFIDSGSVTDFLFSPRATPSSPDRSIVLVRSVLVHPETCGEYHHVYRYPPRASRQFQW
jgi:hypothetical protein